MFHLIYILHYFIIYSHRHPLVKTPTRNASSYENVNKKKIAPSGVEFVLSVRGSVVSKSLAAAEQIVWEAIRDVVGWIVLNVSSK